MEKRSALCSFCFGKLNSFTSLAFLVNLVIVSFSAFFSKKIKTFSDYLSKTEEVSDEAKGIVLEVKKERAMDNVESILYDGTLKVGDEVAIASFSEPILSKVRALEEIEPLAFKYNAISEI